MDECGLWELFYRTGLPEVWLFIAGSHLDRGGRPEELARTAFLPERGAEREV